MSGLTARIQMVSNALLLLGDRPISSLEDETTGSLLGANLFENTYLTMLQDHRWRFATKTQKLSRLANKPETEYQYAFQVPADMLYAIKGDSRKFEIYGNEIHAQSLNFQLDYITRVQEDQLPAYFAKTLEFNLASQFSIPITGDINKADYFDKAFLSAIRKAKATDSTQYPEVEVQDSPYTDVRY